MTESAPAQLRPSNIDAPKEGRKFTRNGRKMNVKGFYYHAAEYQRQKQGERGKIHKIFSSIFEPIIIHERALRLKIAASRNGAGFFRSSAVLDNEFVRQAMDDWTGKQLTKETRERFRAKSTAHGIIEKRMGGDFTEEQEKRVGEVLQRMFDTKGHPTKEDEEAARAIGLTEKDIKEFTQNIQDHEGVFSSPSEIKEKLTDEMLYGGLTPHQQDLAKKLALAAGAMTVTTYAKYGLIALTPITFGQSFLVGFGLGAASRGSRLAVEGLTYDIGKDRGMTMPSTQHQSFLSAWMTVDWEQDKRTQLVQVFRAAALSGLIGVGVKEVTTEFIPWVEHAIAGLHNTSGAGSTGESAAHLTSHGTNPKIRLEPSGKGASSSVVPNRPDGGGHTFPPTPPKGGDALPTVAGTHQETLAQFTQSHDSGLHIINSGKDLNGNVIRHDDGFQAGTEAYGMTDSTDGSTLTIHAYDSLGDQANCLAVQIDGHTMVFLPTGHIDGHPMWQFTPGDSTDHVTMLGPGGQQFQITSGEASNLLHITKGELQTWQTSGNPAGVSSDWDYQVGQNILGHHVTYGYYDVSKGTIQQLGLIRGHSALGGEENAIFTVQNTGLPEQEEHFQSVLAGPLGTVDNWEDRGLEWLREHILNNAAVNKLDQISDFGLINTDNLTLATQQILEKPYLYYPAIAVPYVASGVAGYYYGRTHAQKNPSVLNGATGVTAGGLLAFAYPGMAATAGIGYVIGKLTSKKGDKKARNEETTKVANSQSPSGPSDTPAPASTSAAVPTGDQSDNSLPSAAPTDVPVLPAVPAPPPPPAVPGATDTGVTAPIVPPPAGQPDTGTAGTEGNGTGESAGLTENIEAASTLPVATPEQQNVVQGFLERLRNPENRDFFRHIAELGTLMNVKISPEYWLGEIMSNPSRWQHAISGVLHTATGKDPNTSPFHDTLENLFGKLKDETKVKRLLDFIRLAEFGALFYKLRSHPEIVAKVQQAISQNAHEGIQNVVGALRNIGETVPEEIATVAQEAGEGALPLLEELAPVLAA